MMFSTRDADNDISSSLHCAREKHGAWRYDKCSRSNLNGRYYDSEAASEGVTDGVTWLSWKNNYRSLKKSKMMIRPDV